MNHTAIDIATMERYEYEWSLVSAVFWLILWAWSIGYGMSVLLSRCLMSCKSAVKSSKQGFWWTVCIGLFMALEFPSWIASQRPGLADLIVGTDPRLTEVLKSVPLLTQGPQPPWLLHNRHIQFIPWMIQNEIHRTMGAIPFQRIHIPVTDCQRKKHTLGPTRSCPQHERTMHDTVTVDVFPPFESHDDNDNPLSLNFQQFNQSSPIIFFSPGLRCYSQDLPGNSIVRHAFARGFRSVVFHRRGHTPNQPLQSPRWNLFGDVDDFEQVYWYIHDQYLTPTTPLFLHGISSGTALTVTALAKWDQRRVQRDESDIPTNETWKDQRIPSFVASIKVTPGYDISKVMTNERFLFPYQDILLPGVKDHFVLQNEQLLRQHNATAVDHALAATSLQEFVDATVPFAGYDSTQAYYHDTNPIHDVRHITTPTLVLNSLDDPCCNIRNLYERGTLAHHDNKTYAEMIHETHRAIVAVTRTGSHCPFLCTRNKWIPFSRDPLTSYGYMLHSWADEVALDYYEAALDVYEDRRLLR